MKTFKKIPIEPVYVEFIPEILEADKLYISKEYECAIHLCLCGCGEQSVTPLHKDGWALTENNGKVSLTPSILNTNCPKTYHYVITNNVGNILSNS